jgi:hypothetical protein
MSMMMKDHNPLKFTLFKKILKIWNILYFEDRSFIMEAIILII